MSTFLDAALPLRYDSWVSNYLSRSHLSVLIIGDAVFLLAVTLIGFATHDRSLGGGRWLVTYLPLLGSWVLAAYLLGLYRPGTNSPLKVVGLVTAAAVFAAPLAVMLRALWLQQTMIPVFGLVMMAMTAAGMGLWRLTWAAWMRRRSVSHG